jgi:hypothetical protein
MRSRADNDKLMVNLNHEDTLVAQMMGKEGFRRLEWAKQMILMYPGDCGNVFPVM